ncbi:MAG: hypothetical protein R3C11_03930 [Planctomycetaceae bacterium]
MLTGEPPYPGGTFIQKIFNHEHKDVPDPAAKVPGIPPLLSHIVMKMMASDLSERYRTPNELLHELEEVAQQLGMPGAHSRAFRKTAPISERQAKWEASIGWIIMAVLLISLVIVIDLLLPQTNITPGDSGNSVLNKASNPAVVETDNLDSDSQNPATPVPVNQNSTLSKMTIRVRLHSLKIKVLHPKRAMRNQRSRSQIHR